MADTAIESANKIFKYLQDSDTIMKSSVNRIETIEARWTGQPVIKGILYNNKTEQINSSVA